MLNDLIYELSKDPFNPKLNFDIAVEYEKENQTASAVSFYLRTAEYGFNSHPSEVYASLLKLAKCFEEQNDRLNTVSNCLMQAVSYIPYRPEGYFLMARFHERQGNWQEAYTWASMGLRKEKYPELPVDVDYVDYGLKFEKAVSAWWIGRADESIEIFNKLLALEITEEYRKAIEANLAVIA